MPDGFAEFVDLRAKETDLERDAAMPSGFSPSSEASSPLDVRTHPVPSENFFTDYERRQADRRKTAWERAWSRIDPARLARIPVGRWIRLGIGLGLVVLGGLFTFDRFVALHTSEAMLSAAPMVLRAQIDGVVSVNPMLLGGVVDAQSPIGAITDDRADESRVTELQGAARIAEEQLAALHLRLGQLAAQAQETRGHVSSFRTARTEQLAARLREADATAATAQARARETSATLRRTEALYASQTASGAALDQARANAAAAQSDLAAAVQRQAATKAELTAAGAGVFALDAATDRSVSQQRYDQLQTRAGDLASELATAQAKVDGLHNQLAVEQGRLARRQHVELVLPVRARILRISAQDGELVSRGQEIATAVDCSQPMVTADVSEAVFRKLFVGMPGEFRVSGESTRHAGRIVQMVSPLDDTQGQRPVDAARRRVVLRLEPEGMASSCQVGRMGQVSF
jgi:multidrug resistance efflux pump